VAAFAATNVDGLLLAAALFADSRYRARDVVLGTFAGIGALYAVSVGASLVALVIPEAYIALLGLVPLGIGVKQLLVRSEEPAEAAPARHGALGVAGINIAMGGDNIGVYTPLFAAAPAQAIALYGAVFVLLTAALCYGALKLVSHPAAGAPIRRYARRVMPYVLIALGVWILAGAL
jgi:cadmium resistance protein CadD (predicted permease)